MKHFFLAFLISLSLVSFGRITPAFTCDALSGCSPLVVHMTDQSTGGVTAWSWDLGNGNTSTQQSPSATYFNPGRYLIKLVVSDGVNTDSTFQVVMVFAKPTADFTTSRLSACTNDSIIFTSLATPGDAPINHYAWGFGNGIANNNVSAVYRYANAGLYDVTLVIQDTNGCSATVTKHSYIRVWPSPHAAWTASPLISCGISQNVTFTNQSQGNGLTYLWQFKDSANTTSTSMNPSHIYSYGSYKPELTVTDSNGCSSSSNFIWVAVSNLRADFQTNKTRVCTGESVSFNSLSPSSGHSWYWNFGDGTTSNKQNPKHIYATPGVYSVTFVITDGPCHDSITKTAYITVSQGFTLAMAASQRNSCSTPFTVNFSYTASTMVHCVWDFGNGTTDTSANPSATYTNAASYSVTLTAVDTNGCTITLASPGMINTAKPKPSFTCDTLICPGQKVTFKNNSSGGTHYLWDFGDGDTSSVFNPTHIYAGYGTFTVRLTAIDATGCDSTVTHLGAVRIDSTHVDFKVNEKFSPCPPLVSQFTNLSNRSDLKYRWDFGDGYTDTAANPTHIFFHPGLFTVKLIGTSKQGCTDTIIYPDLILVQGPVGHFSLTPSSGCIPLAVNFTGNVSSNTQTITCDLGNGILYNDSLNFSYTYNAATTFHPKFILTDHVGCTVPYDLDSIVAHPLPTLSLKDSTICPGQPVHMVLGTDMYSWTGTVCDTCGRIPNITDTVAIANLTPQVTTNFNVTATNNYGCSNTGRFTLNVVQLPSLVSPDTIRICKNETTQLGLGQADSIRWTPATYLSSPTSFSPICSSPVSMTYNVTAYNRLGCSVSRQVPVKVLDKVKVSLIPDTAACPGTSLQLNVTAIDTSVNATTTYSWSPAHAMDNSALSSPVAQIGTQTETFQVITRSGVCVPDTSTVTVSIKPAATLKLPVSVLTTPHSDVPLTPVSDNLVSYQWTAKDSLTCSNCESTTLVPITSQMVYLSGANEYGCRTTDSMKINIIPCDPSSIFVPNTFSPNGDGLHDVLYVRSRAITHIDYFRVFDRWGSMIYEGRDMNEGWDGNINGKPAEQGVYVYTVSGKCESGFDVETSGTTTLIR